MNLIIDIGNSIAKLYLFKNNRIIHHLKTEFNKFSTAIDAILNKYHVDACMLSNVGDQTIAKQLNRKAIRCIGMHHGLAFPFNVTYQTPATLGHDRLAAVAGAYAIKPGAHVLVIDAGTAITYDFIDAVGNYQGGSISPGLRMRFRALHDYTHALPLAGPAKQLHMPAQSTLTALQTGVQMSMIFEIDGYINYFSEQYQNLHVIMTGGDALYFEDKLKNPIFVNLNLVAIGLNTILEYNAQ